MSRFLADQRARRNTKKLLNFDYYEFAGSSKNPLSVENTIFLSLDKIEIKNALWPQFRFQAVGRLSISNVSQGSNATLDLLQSLAKRHNDEYGYSLSDTYLQAARQLSEANDKVFQHMLIAIFQLLIVTSTTAGIFYTFQYKDRKSIAIALAVGSTIFQQIFELFIKISIIVFLGSILGEPAYFLWSLVIGNGFIMIYATPFIIVGVSIVMISLSASLALITTLRVNPSETMKDA